MATGMERLTQCGFNRIADRDGVMTIYPAKGELEQSWPLSRLILLALPQKAGPTSCGSSAEPLRDFPYFPDATAAHPS